MRPSSLVWSFALAGSVLVSAACVKKRTTDNSQFASTSSQPYEVPGQMKPEQNAPIWNQFCVGNPNDADIPKPNYANAKVLGAAKILSTVSETSFSLYSDIIKVYAWGGETPKEPIDGVKVLEDAHKFLVYLCGEFRDRASMIEAKLDWVLKIHRLPNTKQQAIDTKKDFWSQITAESYRPFLAVSNAYYTHKLEELSQKKFTLGSFPDIDAPTPATTRCEVKYMFVEYASKGKTFDGLENFRKGLKTFEAAHCAPEDHEYYIDFRGDSNFKPNSPESNAMIWYTRSIARNCESPSKAKNAEFGDDKCRAYFKEPFKSRWLAARAGLGSWLLRDKSHDAYFEDTNNLVTVLPNLEPANRPFDFELSGSTPQVKFMPDWDKHWNRPDLGLPMLGDGSLHDFYYRRLRDAVNRHTDWYASGYNDGYNTSNSVYTQAYSPFVASSYEMSVSDGFTGANISGLVPSDGFKHWMFVFKVKKENWYNSESISKKIAPNFDYHWFDETSLGTVSLAKGERAWDRLGTPLEGEFETILYLHQIDQGGGLWDYEKTLPVKSSPIQATFVKTQPSQSSDLDDDEKCEIKPEGAIETFPVVWSYESEGHMSVTLKESIKGCGANFKRGASIYIFKSHFPHLKSYGTQVD